MKTHIVIVFIFFILIIFNNVLAADKYILIDPGHGGEDNGAVRDGINEKDINLSAALKLYNICCESNSHYEKVRITRYTDKTVGISPRWKMANSYGTTEQKDDLNQEIPEDGVTAFISIHCDANNDPNDNNGPEYGTTVYIGENDDTAPSIGNPWVGTIDWQPFRKKKSTNFAIVALQAYLHWVEDYFLGNDYIPQLRSRWIKIADKDVIEKTEMPAILIEMDFLSNATARSYLLNVDYQNAGMTGLWHSLDWTDPSYIYFVDKIIEGDQNAPVDWGAGRHVLIKNSSTVGNALPTSKTYNVTNGDLNIHPNQYIIVDDNVAFKEGTGGQIIVDQSCSTDHIFLGEDASIEGFDPDAVTDPFGDYPATTSPSLKCEVFVWPEFIGVWELNKEITIPFYDVELNEYQFNHLYTLGNSYHKDDWEKGRPLTAYGDPDIFFYDGKYYKYLKYDVSANYSEDDSKGIIIKAYNDINGTGANDYRKYFMKHYYAEIGETTFKTYLRTTNEFDPRHVIKFKDPWYIDPVNPLYAEEGLPRKNLGKDAVFRTINKVTRNGANKGYCLILKKMKSFMTRIIYIK